MLREQFYFHIHRKKFTTRHFSQWRKRKSTPKSQKRIKTIKKNPTYIFRLFRAYMEIASVGRTMFEIIPTMECYTLHIYIFWLIPNWHDVDNEDVDDDDDDDGVGIFSKLQDGKAGWMDGWLVGTTNVQSKNICSFLNIIIFDREKKRRKCRLDR